MVSARDAGRSRWLVSLLLVRLVNQQLWRSGGLSSYVMLLVAVMLTASEMTGLVALYADYSLGRAWVAFVLTALSIGVLVAALAPVAIRFGQLFFGGTEPYRRKTQS
jgi:hypothetical protein